MTSPNNFELLIKSIRNPRTAFRFAKKGFLSRDRVFHSQAGWNFGGLSRVSLLDLFPQSAGFDFKLARALDRKWMTSLMIEELCALLAIARSVNARNILEIGTWDGNTTLNLAANTDAAITTVDLPPKFDAEAETPSLAFPEAELNVTDRAVLGRQFNNHPLGDRIRQVYGDSARLNWGTLGGPFDLIFIDGCHDQAYVKSDTDNARANLRKGGVIVWHDYGMIEDVCRVVDSLQHSATDFRICALEGTRFAVALQNSNSR